MSFKVTTLHKIVVIEFIGVLDIEAVRRLQNLTTSGITTGGAVLDFQSVEFANDGALIKLFKFCKEHEDGHAIILCNVAEVIKKKIATVIGRTPVDYRGTRDQAVARLKARQKRKKTKP